MKRKNETPKSNMLAMLGGIAGVVAIIAVFIATAQLWQNSADSKKQDKVQSTLMSISNQQLSAQQTLIALQQNPSSPQKIEAIKGTLAALENERLFAQMTLTPGFIGQTSTHEPTQFFSPTTTNTAINTALPSNTPLPTFTATLALSLPFEDNFNQGLDKTWKVVQGQPVIVSGRLGALPGGLTIEIDSGLLTNYTVEFEVDCCDGGAGSAFGYTVVFGERLRYNDMPAYSHGVWEVFQNNRWTQIARDETDLESPAQLRFTFHDNTYKLFRNGTLITEIVYGTPVSGPISISMNDRITIDNFKLSAP